jgi:hypothetical protein
VTNTMRNAVVSFKAPTSGGGSTITGYNVTAETGFGASAAGTPAGSAGFCHLLRSRPAASRTVDPVQRSARTGTAPQLIPPDERWGRLAKRVGPNGSGFITVMKCSTAFGRSLRWH